MKKSNRNRKNRPERRAKGEGSIYPYKDGYAGQVDLGRDPVSGKRNRKTVYGSTQTEVAEKIRRLLLRRSNTPLVVDYLRQWLEEISDTLSPSTREDYIHRVESLVIPYCPAVQLEDLTASHIVQILQLQKQKGLSSDQRRRTLEKLRQALSHAVRLGIVDRNQGLSVPLPRRNESNWYILSKEEIVGLLRASQGVWRAFLRLSLDSGARINELLALQWGDLDPATRELRIQRTWSKVWSTLELKAPKTKAGKRIIVLTPETVDLLKPLQGTRSDWMFATKRGTAYRRENFSRSVWKPTLRRAGLSKTIRFHDLRHTCASLLLAAGVSVVEVAARLGHASPDITLKVYAHLIPRESQRSADLLSDLLG